MTKRFFLLVLLWFVLGGGALAEEHRLLSPDGKIEVQITTGDQLLYGVSFNGHRIVQPSPLKLEVGGEVLGVNSRLRSARFDEKDCVVPSPFYKKSEIRDYYNELRLSFRERFDVVFRAYDSGVAYRFELKHKKPVTIDREPLEIRFAEDYVARVPYVKKTGDLETQFYNSFENTYTCAPLSQLDHDRLIFLPLMVELGDQGKMVITESDLMDYPGLYLKGGRGQSLDGVQAPAPAETRQGGYNELQQLVVRRNDYLAKVEGDFRLPWRVFALAERDAELVDNDLVYTLATPSRIVDTSWIKPGKVAWEWWNDWNLTGVDFRAGVNNDTYKYYIDFAANHNLEYVILDEGWAVNKKADLMQVVPEIDLEMLVDYAAERNVGIILWAGYWAFHRDMERVVAHYAKMGVKGFKIDFLDRDDADMVRFTREAAEVCARHHMLLDLHGIYKPTGLMRTYPNILNYEGVNGLEQLKWAGRDLDMVAYDVTIPFVRMLAGPMDYTQGAMNNGTYWGYHACVQEPMSQGTRCHQLAAYVVFESPVTMLCDSPSNYMREEESTRFIAQVPTVWDETVALDGEVGEYVAVARRSGEEWYIGTMTNWTAREIELDFGFLPARDYQIEIFRDGVNADRKATDYKRVVEDLSSRKLTVRMAPGGGFAARIFTR